MFFYGHPQNRFWRVLAFLLNVPAPETSDDKKKMLLSHNIAVWDVIASCDITGSSDSSIKNVVPNDIGAILRGSRIKRIFVNGGTALRMYNKYILPITDISAVYLPSTSPANVAWTLERLCGAWKVITDSL